MAFIEPMHHDKPDIFFSALQFFNINYDNQSYDLIAIYVWNFPCWNPKLCVRCYMAFIEPMHYNKSNMT